MYSIWKIELHTDKTGLSEKKCFKCGEAAIHILDYEKEISDTIRETHERGTTELCSNHLKEMLKIVLQLEESINIRQTVAKFKE